MNPLDRLEQLSTNWKQLAASVTDKEYRKLVAFDNATSYSQLLDLHKCPRLYQLRKADAKQPTAPEADSIPNVDFAFGHSVGAGVSTYAATKSLTAALFAAFISWKAPYELDNGKGKSLAHAQIAIELFANSGLCDEWEIYTLESGHPAVEVAFVVDFENGFQHYGHIDFIMRHKETGRVAVWECKTTGFRTIDEAQYFNSSQGLSYGVVLDSIEPDQSDYEVNYIVYSSTEKAWHLLPLVKSLTEKAAWLQDVLLDHSTITTYQKLNFYPKRGESCANQFGRRCQYFGICDLTSHIGPPQMIPEGRTAENVNFKFKLSELVAQQRNKE